MYQTPDDPHDIQTSRVITLGAEDQNRGVDEGGCCPVEVRSMSG